MNEINRNKKCESTCVHDMDVHKSLWESSVSKIPYFKNNNKHVWHFLMGFYDKIS